MSVELACGMVLVVNGTLPQWIFVTPNIVNDGHDTTIEFAASFLEYWLLSLLTDPRVNDAETLIVVTFDENETHSIQNIKDLNQYYVLGPKNHVGLESITLPRKISVVPYEVFLSIDWLRAVSRGIHLEYGLETAQNDLFFTLVIGVSHGFAVNIAIGPLRWER
ncbi:hypothetical protein B0H16DRAFT_1467688 [Mycena metata]|uniref:Uncharacterized protein n=1 Tax=Mycena metata TaxID=1033252 RepID=A0AAD7MVV1_9AGAR|nr:hypothetical protein B0H16DRAFT_1467688 [Mycena metata]